MFSLPSIKSMNDSMAGTEELRPDAKLFYEFIELLENANKFLDEAEGNLQASFHVLHDLEHVFHEENNLDIAPRIKSIRESLAKFGGILRKKQMELKETEVIVWGLHKEQEKKNKKKKKTRVQKGKK